MYLLMSPGVTVLCRGTFITLPVCSHLLCFINCPLSITHHQRHILTSLESFHLPGTVLTPSPASANHSSNHSVFMFCTCCYCLFLCFIHVVIVCFETGSSCLTQAGFKLKIFLSLPSAEILVTIRYDYLNFLTSTYE